jgi:hypothetical protein
MPPGSDIRVSANKNTIGGKLAETLKTAFSHVRGKLAPMWINKQVNTETIGWPQEFLIPLRRRSKQFPDMRGLILTGAFYVSLCRRLDSESAHVPNRTP